MRVPQLTQRRVALACLLILVGLLTVVYTTRQYRTSSTPTTNHSTKQSATSNAIDRATSISSSTPSSAPVTKQPVTTELTNYTYTAQPGDSYTLFARQAIQSYAEAHHIALSSGEALNDEIALTDAAGSPEIEIGEQIVISQASLSTLFGEASQTPAPAVSKTPAAPASATSYTYTTQPGDSYTTLARQAITDYTAKAMIQLSHAQSIAAETFVTNAAGAPAIDTSETIIISNDVLKSAVDNAKHLTPDQLASWNQYAISVYGS